jgi:hypothetical protein
MPWNYNLNDRVIVKRDGRYGIVVKALEDTVTVRFQDGSEEIFLQDSDALNIDTSPSVG